MKHFFFVSIILLSAAASLAKDDPIRLNLIESFIPKEYKILANPNTKLTDLKTAFPQRDFSQRNIELLNKKDEKVSVEQKNKQIERSRFLFNPYGSKSDSEQKLIDYYFKKIDPIDLQLKISPSHRLYSYHEDPKINIVFYVDSGKEGIRIEELIFNKEFYQ